MFLGIRFGTYVAGGADPYGYVSQADLWYEGRTTVDQRWVTEVPWPGGQWVFAPLGYKPAFGHQSVAIAPTYAPGLPLLMAGARAVGGPCAMFWVVPLAGGVLVLATYGLGRSLSSPAAGLVAAALVASSPVVLFMLMQPMTDVPVAAAWAAALWLLIGGSAVVSPGLVTARTIAAGLAAAVAILIRPNLVPAILALALWFPLRAWSTEPSRRWRLAIDGVAFALAAATGAIAIAAINRHWYGSALSSGYGGLDSLFAAANIWANVVLYGGWFLQSQTVWPLLGLVPLAVPLRGFWPAARDRAGVVVLIVFAGVITAMYLVYFVFEAWWYLRFLIPAWPALMIGFAALVVSTGRRGRVLGWLAAGAIIWLGARNVVFARDHSAFRLWQEERRYAAMGQLVRGATEPSSIIFAMQHSGSVRRYGGRVTLRFDNLDDAWLDRAIAWLTERGVPAYLVIEDWEAAQFRNKFRTQAAVSRVDGAPIMEYGQVRLYDLRATRDRDASVMRLAPRWDGPRCQAVAPAAIQPLQPAPGEARPRR